MRRLTAGGLCCKFEAQAQVEVNVVGGKGFGMRPLVLLASLLVLGCASTLAPTPTAHRRIGEDPLLNSRVQRSVGEVIYQTYNYEQVMAARLGAPATIDVLGAKATLPTGTLLDQFEEREGVSYCTRDLALHVTLSGPMSRVCLGDSNGNGAFDAWKAPEGPPARRPWGTLRSEVPFTTEEVSGATTQGFRYELLYQGISDQVVSLLYREYINDLARPAFQQDLFYTLSPSGSIEVSFRGTKIRIYSADNNSLDYEILSGLTGSSNH